MSDNKSLYQISAELEQLLADDTADLFGNNEEHDAAIQRLLEVDLPNKVDGYAEYAMYLDDQYNTLLNRANEFEVAAKAAAKKRERLLKHLKECMERLDFDHIHTKQHKVAIRLNPEKVVVDYDTLIPAGFYTEKIERKLDKAALKDWLKEGNQLDGVYLVRDTRLEVK